jgi:hypothetical protein
MDMPDECVHEECVINQTLWGSITSAGPLVGAFGRMVRVMLSIMYAAVRAVLGLVVLRARGGAAKDVELLMLRHGRPRRVTDTR